MAAATKETDVQAPDPADVLRAISDLASSVQALGARVDSLATEQQRTAPRYVPMQRDVRPLQPERPDARDALKGMRPGEERDGSRQLPVDHRGRLVDTNRYRQQFRPGEVVRIVREAQRGTARVIKHPAQFMTDDTGRQHLVAEAWRELIPLTWGEVLDGLAQGGVIACPNKVNGDATCSNRVRVGEPCEACGYGPTVKQPRHLTKAGEWKYVVRVPGLTRHAGDGFMEWELEPA